MKRLIILSLIILLTSCNSDPSKDYALLTGKVENASADELIIKNSNYKKEIPLNSDGTFKDTLKLSEPEFYTLSVGRERTTTYLKNGDDLNITLDANQFDETLTYKGKGASENNYLASKELNVEKFVESSNAFYGLDELDFKARVDSINTTNLALLNGLEEADPKFVNTETKNLQYDTYAYLKNYESYHRYYTQNEDFQVSDGFLPKELKNLVYDDAKAYKISTSYKKMALNDILNTIFDSLGNDYLYASPKDLESIENIKIPALKNDIIDYLGGFLVSPGNPNMKSVYEFFKANADDEKIKAMLTEVFEKGKDLMKGNPSPQFTNYENHKGGEMSLSDLKGKYVYIDVWATWCGPCKQEIPHLQEVEKQFHGKNIEFVSTSIDVARDHDKWFEMVNDLSLGGTQLFADDDWNSKFVRDYGIEGIPRFILVDPDGNIVSADAPRPSNPRLVELLNSLNI